MAENHEDERCGDGVKAPPRSSGLTYRDLDELRGADAGPTGSAAARSSACARLARTVRCKRSPAQLLLKYLPFVSTLRHYDAKKNLLPDILAGLSVSVLHTGQGLGYAALANMPPRYGICVSFFHSLVYFFFGTSHHLSVGTHSLSSLLVGAIIAREVDSLGPTLRPTLVDVSGSNGSDPSMTTVAASTAVEDIEQLKVGIASTLGLLVGVIMLVLGVLRVGALLVNFLSPPFIGGFTCAAAFHIASSQLKYAAFGRGSYIGSYSGPLKLYYLWRDFFLNFLRINWLCSVCFLGSLAVLLAVKMGINKNPRFRHRLPAPLPVDLLVIVAFTALSYYFSFESIPDAASGVEVVGPMQVGLPPPALPTFYKWPSYIGDAFVLALVGYLFNYTMANFFKEKYRYRISEDQEMLAAGVCHVTGAFFGCFPGSASPPRCFMQDAAGGRTQVAGLVSCAVLALVLYVLAPYLYYLPFAVIAALICVALKRLMLQLRDLASLWRQNKVDFVVWLVTFVATLALDIQLGMIAGVACHAFMVAVRLQLNSVYAVARVREADAVDVVIYEGRKSRDGSAAGDAPVLCLRYDAPILYLNCERLIKSMVKKAANATWRQQGVPESVDGSGCGAVGELAPPGSVEAKPPAAAAAAAAIRAVALDCSYVGYIDMAGAKALTKAAAALRESGVLFYLAACSPPVRTTLKRVAPSLYESAFVTLVDVERHVALAIGTHKSDEQGTYM